MPPRWTSSAKEGIGTAYHSSSTLWFTLSHGIVFNVAFLTAIDRRDDLGLPDCFEVFYGMADRQIGVARLKLPEQLPTGALADAPRATV